MVDFQSLGDVLGTLDAEAIAMKAAQGSKRALTAYGSPLGSRCDGAYFEAHLMLSRVVLSLSISHNTFKPAILPSWQM